MNLATIFLVTEANEAASTHFCEIIDSDKNEAMSIGSGGLDLSNHVNAHIANGHRAIMTFRGMGGTWTLSA